MASPACADILHGKSYPRHSKPMHNYSAYRMHAVSVWRNITVRFSVHPHSFPRTFPRFDWHSNKWHKVVCCFVDRKRTVYSQRSPEHTTHSMQCMPLNCSTRSWHACHTGRVMNHATQLSMHPRRSQKTQRKHLKRTYRTNPHILVQSKNIGVWQIILAESCCPIMHWCTGRTKSKSIHNWIYSTI